MSAGGLIGLLVEVDTGASCLSIRDTFGGAAGDARFMRVAMPLSQGKIKNTLTPLDEQFIGARYVPDLRVLPVLITHPAQWPGRHPGRACYFASLDRDEIVTASA